MALAVDFLVVLVPLARQHHHIVSAGAGNQLGNGGTTTGNEGGLGGIFEADTDVIENLAWVCCAGCRR